jgi:hypothetical protein
MDIVLHAVNVGLVTLLLIEHGDGTMLCIVGFVPSFNSLLAFSSSASFLAIAASISDCS